MLDSKKTSLRKILPWDIIPVSLFFFLCLYITIHIGDKSYDDAFITYRYAKNLASGNGYVFNPGEIYLGTTTPLYTALLAFFKIIFLAALIPSIGQWLTGGALFCLAFFTYLLGRDDDKPIAGIVSALFVLLNPLFVQVWGGESILAIAFTAAAFYFYFHGYEILPAIMIGLCFLTRGEGVLPGVVLMTHYAITKKKIPWRAVIAFCITILPWLIYSFSAFGSPLPGSLHAKTAQMDSGQFFPFFPTLLFMFRAFIQSSPIFTDIAPHTSYLLAGVLACIGGISLIIHKRQTLWWSMTAWLVLYTVGYTLLDIPFYHWYSIPILYGVMILAGLGSQFINDFVQDKIGDPQKGRRTILAGILIILVALPLAAGFTEVHRYVTTPVSLLQSIYVKTARWLRENTPPSATIGYVEIGLIGYYSNRTLIEPVGLLKRDVSEQVARSNFKWAYLHYKPDYLVINPIRWYDIIGSIRDEPWFDSSYREIGSIEQVGFFDSPMIIYQKFDDGAIPSQE